MRKWISLSVVVIFMSLLLGLPKPSACQSEYYKMNEDKCAKYIELSQEAISGNDYYEATLYAKRAVQENPWNRNAWINYNNIIVKMTGGNINLIPHTKKLTKENGN